MDPHHRSEPEIRSADGVSEHPAAETAVVIAVLTYQRHEQIAALVPVLESQAVEVETAIPTLTVRILVIDNEATGAAEGAVSSAIGRVNTTYVIEPARGIAGARNRALDEATTDDLLVFIDDDEVPDPGWLRRLVETALAHPTASVSGPVRTTFDGTIDPWILEGKFLSRDHRRHTRTGDRIATAATNNLLLDLATVRRVGVRFNPLLDLSGGEDTHFTSLLTRRGGKIIWCAEAWVTDVRPAERLTRATALARAYGFSNSAAHVQLMLEPPGSGRVAVWARLLVGSVARVTVGAASVVIGKVAGRRHLRANGARLVARGRGTMTALLGSRHQQYR